MLYPTIFFRVRVTDDDKHCIYVNDFDAFEDCVLQLCSAHLDETQVFAIKFEQVKEVEDDEIPF